jgi:hypothetical protein
VQRYECLGCESYFQSKRRHQTKRGTLYDQYVFKRQNLAQLAEQEDRSLRWVQAQLDAAKATHDPLPPQPTVIGADTTFWGEGYGVCVFRSPTLKRNLCWTEVEAETTAVYDQSLRGLLHRGWQVTGAVIDGRRGVAKVFERHGIPVQHCQFHQMKTVTKYLTRTPQSLAGQELRRLACTLHKTTEPAFVANLTDWLTRHESFFNERSPAPHRKSGWEYTHRKLRAAYHSLKTNLPYLFTYQKYPDLKIPNTTNSLDGMFSQLKNKLAVHRGLRRDRRFKMISAILAQKPKTSAQKRH